ncbi:MAG: hypothetical protein J5I65_04085 [Aridibacter famidurans]|nr:hypothetical protein [Aridibacter famidurans]
MTSAKDADDGTEELSGYLEGTGLSVDKLSLLPRRAGDSRLLTFGIGEAVPSGRLLDSIEETPTVSLTNTRSDKGPVSRQRNFELATDRIVALAVDATGKLLWWDIQPDPRVLRAETADAGGNLTGSTFYRSVAELLVTIPSDPSITSLYIYVPEWNGRDAYSLKELGELDVR